MSKTNIPVPNKAMKKKILLEKVKKFIGNKAVKADCDTDHKNFLLLSLFMLTLKVNKF